MAVSKAQVIPGSIFAKGGNFAVTSRCGSILDTTVFDTRDEAWAEFQRRGSDPAHNGVSFTVHPGLVEEE